MNIKTVIEKALNHYLQYVKTYMVYDWETKAVAAEKCLAYISNGAINIDWIKNNSIMAEVLETYHRELDSRIKENDSVVDISVLREERRLIYILRHELNGTKVKGAE